MSDSPEVIPPEFPMLVVPEELNDMLDRVRAAVAARKDRQTDMRHASWGWMSLIPVSGVWMIGMALMRWSSGSFDFAWSMMGSGLCGAVSVAVCSACLALWFRSEHRYTPIPTWAIKIAIAVVACTLVYAALPFFPLAMGGVLFLWSAWLKFGPITDDKDRPYEFGDARFKHLRGFADHAASWKQVIEWANDLRMRVECNMLTGGDRERAIALLKDLLIEEEFIRDRMRYCAGLARQGELGTRLTHASLGENLMGDLGDRLQSFRAHVRELQEFDRRAIAAGEVHRRLRVVK